MANINYLNRLEKEKKDFENNSKKEIKKYMIEKDTIIEINKSEEVIINIEKDSSLAIKINSKKPISTLIKIMIKKKVNAKLFEISNSKNSFIEKIFKLEEDSNLNYSQIILSGRMNSTIVGLEENSSYNLNSSFKIDNEETYIYNAAVNNKQDSYSNLEVNGVSLNGAKVTNDGLIRIEQEAPNSEGYQKLNNLILDDISGILSEPILEIENNNVKCSHGASISQIKDEILFYANSRGLSKDEATNLVIGGFFTKCLENLDDNKLKTEIEKII